MLSPSAACHSAVIPMCMSVSTLAPAYALPRNLFYYIYLCGCEWGQKTKLQKLALFPHPVGPQPWWHTPTKSSYWLQETCSNSVVKIQNLSVCTFSLSHFLPRPFHLSFSQTCSSGASCIMLMTIPQNMKKASRLVNFRMILFFDSP